MLKVGIIGFGGIAGVHYQCWCALEQYAKVVAIADLREERRAEIPADKGIAIYENGDDLLENADVDIIDICVPTYEHTRFAVAAMKKGRHVFMEKPVCLNEEEAQLLLKTQEETGAKVQVGHVVRFEDAYPKLKEFVDNNTYGKLICAEFHRLAAHVLWSWDNWYQDPDRSGSVALDLHVHDVDFVRYLMSGDPDTVSSVGTRNKDGVLQQIFTTYQYGDTIITAIGSWDFANAFPFTQTFYAKFEQATVVYGADRKVTIYTKNGETLTPDLKEEFKDLISNGTNISNLGPYYNELKYFLTETLNGGKEIAPLSEAVKSARLAWKEIACVGGAKI